MSPPRLSLSTLPEVPARSGPGFDPRRARIGVVHLGPGAFFRAHQAPVYDRLLEDGGGDWGVCGVSLHSADVDEALSPQDGLYALKILGAEAPARVIGCLRELCVATRDGEAVRARLASPETSVVALTVTEKGYHLDAAGELDLAAVAHDLAEGWPFETIYGWLADALARRRRAGLEPWLVLSCDNLADNGPRLKRALVAFARARRDAALADWIDRRLVAPATMVDSITPATEAALREVVTEELGLMDAWPVQREPFAQWVIEDVGHPRLTDLARAGVTLTGDLAGYERAKLRLLNGAHSTLAYLGLLAGLETVSEAIAEPRLARFVEALMRRDLLPTVRPPAGLGGDAYVGSVLERFRNPAIRHRLAQIAADGSRKLPVRLGAPAEEAAVAGADLARLAVPFAAWMRWLPRADALQDPAAVDLRTAAKAATGDPEADVARFLHAGEVLPARLRKSSPFMAALHRAYAGLGADDPLAAL